MDISKDFQLIQNLLATAVNLPCTMISLNEEKDGLSKLTKIVLQEDFTDIPMPQNFSAFYKGMKPEVIYKIKNKYFTYSFVLLLPSANSFLVFGPCLTEEISSNFLSDVIKFNHFKFEAEQSLRLHYQSMPYIPLSKVSSLCQLLARDLFHSTVDIPYESFDPKELTITDYRSDESKDNETLIALQSVEQRYRKSNEIMEAVKNGNSTLALTYLEHIRYEIARIQRNRNPLRNFQNLCIVTNSMLKKAVEEAGVHPFFIDQLSNEFGLLIEQKQTPLDLESLTEDMIERYCLLVKENTQPQVSVLIQQTVTYIKINLTEDLELKNVAKILHVNADYLSQRFKKEMNISFTNYVNKQRIKQAVFLLKDNHFNIQEISSLSGYQDVNYFIKRFKKEMGCTPSSYRKFMEQ